jgi:BirA family transcriptional regulator, biotin operon repressor / biotin---[acetyl-CoA-carboxylase] ligase
MTTKEKLLAKLKAHAGQWISGEQVSNQLGISRAAIWKQINGLKSDGHGIQSLPKKGYRLARAADLMLPAEIAAGLTTRVMGRSGLVCLKETDSTNLQAKARAAQGADEGTVVVAETQTSGRGRRGRSWFSSAGRSIYASIILRPPMAPAQAPQITLMTAVAVAQTLRETAQLNATIKWPNDILIDGKKIAGILTEISTDMDVVDYVVVGLGINVNTLEKEMPADIRAIATSALIQKGAPVERVTLLCALLKNFERCYDQLKSDGFAPIMAQWRRMSDIIGQPVYVDVLEKRYTGIVAAVDDDGVLILEDKQGHRHRIFSGDVTRLRKT